MVALSEFATKPRHAIRSRDTLAYSPLATQRFAVSYRRSGENSVD
jgi:hypothetical protein